MYFTSGAATQPVTSNVFSGTSDNQIIGVQVTLNGTCGNLTATSFSFNTTGTFGSTNASADIAAAKLYYTGTTNVFSTSTLFGTAALPNGAFNITGSLVMPSVAGTYYFWLVYDIKAVGTAIPGDYVDAQVSSVTLSGTPYAFSGNPVGSRQISDNVYYSINNGNWNDPLIWSRSFGGPSCGCAPTTGSGLAYVYHNVSVNGSYTIDVVSVQAGGNLTNTLTNALNITQTLSTAGTGIFNISSAWTLKDVTTSGTGTSLTSVATTIGGNLNVGAGTTLSKTAGALTVNGNLTVDGTIALGANSLTASNVAGIYVSGTGSITGTGTMTLGVAKTIPAGSNLTISPVLAISSGINITNQGTVNMQNDITGGNVNSTWINDAGSVLNMAGTTSTLLATGTLNATTVPNEVIYSGNGSQSVKNATYHNVTFRNATKTLTAALTVNNDIKIDLAGQLDVSASNYAINLYGNWINNSTNAVPFMYRTGTVNFNGLTTISGTAISAFNNIDITTDGTLIEHATTGHFMVAGNWINDGTDDNNSSDVTFIPASGAGGAATGLISGTSTTTFNNIIVNNGKTLTLHIEETDFEGTITNNGSILHNNALVGIYGATAAQSIGGTTTLNTLYDIEIDNEGGTMTINQPLIVADSLILTNGVVFSSSANTIKLTNTSANIIRGGSTISYVSGPLVRVLPSGLTASASVYNFPVGKSGIYFPMSFTTLTTGATGPTVTTEAFSANAGGTADGVTLGSLSTTEYWNASFTGNYTNGKVSITRQSPLGGFALIGRSATQTGIYASIGGTVSGTSIINSNLTGAGMGYFLMSQNCTPSTYYADLDGDTYGDGASTISSCALPLGYVANNFDCNDANSSIHPGATEICNGIDDDCSGVADNGLTFVTYFVDADGDTYGNAAISTSTCSGAPAGYVTDFTDCNDANGSIHPGASEVCNAIDDNCSGAADEGLTFITYYNDADGDMYGDAAVSTSTCSGAPAGYVANNTDCNDANSSINPGATEICNAIDDDCNGVADDGLTFTTWYGDADGDGFGDNFTTTSTCDGAPAGYIADHTDCNDASAAAYPGGTEICDGLDNNCDGNIDEGVVTADITPAVSAITCKGVPYTLSVDVCEGCTYQWFKNDNAIAGATSPTYSTSKPAYYSVQVNLPAGCFSTSEHTLLSTVENPSANILFPNGLNICAPTPGTNIILKVNYTASNTYQWYKDGVPYTGTGADSWRIFPTATGLYYCMITNAAGCSRATDSQLVINVCRENEQAVSELLVYPNPASDLVNIHLSLAGDETNATMEILDILGNSMLVKQIELVNGELSESINTGSYTSGVYLVKITAGNYVQTTQLVVGK